jgi:hypothetical protein
VRCFDPSAPLTIALVNADVRVSAPVKVQRDELQVMFRRAAADSPAAIQGAWAEFEAAVGVRGRKFFGAYNKGQASIESAHRSTGETIQRRSGSRSRPCTEALFSARAWRASLRASTS